MRKRWSWSVSGYQMTDKTQEEIFFLCQQAGIAGIEGVPPLFSGLSDQELETVGREYSRQGIKIETFHLPFAASDDVASFYESVRKKACDNIRVWIERAALLGVNVAILHPTTSRFSVDVEGVDRYMQALGRSLEKLLPLAADLGISIAIENMLPGQGGRFGSRIDHFTLIASEFAHPNLGFCLDTGHALVAQRGEFSQLLAAMGSNIRAFHLQDNAGDRDSHLAPGHGLVDWKLVFTNMMEMGYSGTACIEAPPFSYGPDYSLESWQQLIAETDALATKALKEDQ